MSYKSRVKHRSAVISSLRASFSIENPKLQHIVKATSFIFRRKLHIVSVKVSQIGIVVCQDVTRSPFEFDRDIVFNRGPFQALLLKRMRSSIGYNVTSVPFIELPAQAIDLVYQVVLREKDAYDLCNAIQNLSRTPAIFREFVSAANDIEILPKLDLLIQLLLLVLFIGKHVIREKIDPNSLAHVEMSRVFFRVDGILPPDLAKHEPTVRLCSVSLQREPIIELAGSELAEPIIVFSRHSYIDVIIPRDEAPMAHRPQARTASKKILQIILFTNAQKLIEQFKFELLDKVKIVLVCQRIAYFPIEKCIYKYTA